jgi:hypothetical protein
MGWEGDGWTALSPFGRRLDRPKGVHDGWTAMDKFGRQQEDSWTVP